MTTLLGKWHFCTAFPCFCNIVNQTQVVASLDEFSQLVTILSLSSKIGKKGHVICKIDDMGCGVHSPLIACTVYRTKSSGKCFCRTRLYQLAFELETGQQLWIWGGSVLKEEQSLANISLAAAFNISKSWRVRWSRSHLSLSETTCANTQRLYQISSVS